MSKEITEINFIDVHKQNRSVCPSSNLEEIRYAVLLHQFGDLILTDTERNALHSWEQSAREHHISICDRGRVAILNLRRVPVDRLRQLRMQSAYYCLDVGDLKKVHKFVVDYDRRQQLMQNIQRFLNERETDNAKDQPSLDEPSFEGGGNNAA